MNRDYSQLRKDFEKHQLNEAIFSQHPVYHIREWLNEAIEANEQEPTAMTLSTVSPKGRPSGRIVLLKYLDDVKGLWFFTNYDSKKGKHIKHNDFAALSFFWPGLERQIRIEGKIVKLTDSESDEYFYSRPKDSQIGAIISPQSQVIESREQLERWYNELKERKESLVRPQHWGGYALIPDEIEFWQGRAGRLHDRIRYRLDNMNWIKERLAP